MPPPPAKVTVATPTKQPVTDYLEATGNTAAVNATDLVARVPGFVAEIKYQDGALVTKGTLLFTIEPEPYRVKVEQSQAAETGAAANLKVNQNTLQRQSELLKSNNTPQSNYDWRWPPATPRSQLGPGESQYGDRETQLRLYAGDGAVRRHRGSTAGVCRTDVGGTATPTVLASIVQRDPIYVNFNISERDVLRIRPDIARRGLTQNDIRKIVVEVGLQTESGYPHQGNGR